MYPIHEKGETTNTQAAPKVLSVANAPTMAVSPLTATEMPKQSWGAPSEAVSSVETVEMQRALSGAAASTAVRVGRGGGGPVLRRTPIQGRTTRS